MSKKSRDTEYLAISAELRAMERMRLTREKLEQAALAPTAEEALKIVRESGYPMLNSAEPREVEQAIQAERQRLEEWLRPELLEIFRCPCDYHNLKTLLKVKLVGVDARRILLPFGRMEIAELRQAVEENTWERLPDRLGEAGAAAKELLNTTQDGQQMDIFLDRACFDEQLEMARQSGSAFLVGFLRRSIDSANLRALVRALRMEKTVEFLRQALIFGGEIAQEEILTVSANGGSGLSELYAATPFAAAAEKADLTGEASLADFERLCDDAVTAYLDRANFLPFGEEVVVSYVAAKETEWTNLRLVLLGRSIGLPPEEITQRLRA